MDTATRLTTYVARCAENSPGIWREIDAYRAAHASTWPSYSFLPVAHAWCLWRAWSGGQVPADTLPLVATLPMLAAWRVTQGIYRFDPDVLAAVWETPIAGELPAQVLLALPEWCIYIDLGGRAVGGRPAEGAFCWLDHPPALRFSLDYGREVEHLPPLVLAGTLPESIAAAEAQARRDAERLPEYREHARALLEGSPADLAARIGPPLNLVLYVCAANAEIAGGVRPARPRPVRTRHGDRLFPPAQPRLWECGYRIGAAIRAARAQERQPSAGGVHASPRPHIRRAHWHSFWAGPKTSPELERRLVLHWLPPTPVNVTDEAGPVPTIHPVH